MNIASVTPLLLLFLATACTSFSPLRNTAQVCEPAPLERPLNLVHAETDRIPEAPKVSFMLNGSILEARFEVTTDPSGINAKSKLGPGEYPYEFDVAEVFLKTNKGSEKEMTYFEFEVTPLNQNLQIKIEVKDGKKKFSNPQETTVTTEAQITETGWVANFSIPLEKFGWRGNARLITGNAFIIVGKPKKKSYWALDLPPQSKPTFHLPEHFVELVPACGPTIIQNN